MTVFSSSSITANRIHHLVLPSPTPLSPCMPPPHQRVPLRTPHCQRLSSSRHSLPSPNLYFDYSRRRRRHTPCHPSLVYTTTTTNYDFNHWESYTEFRDIYITTPQTTTTDEPAHLDRTKHFTSHDSTDHTTTLQTTTLDQRSHLQRTAHSCEH